MRAPAVSLRHFSAPQKLNQTKLKSYKNYSFNNIIQEVSGYKSLALIDLIYNGYYSCKVVKYMRGPYGFIRKSKYFIVLEICAGICQVGEHVE